MTVAVSMVRLMGQTSPDRIFSKERGKDVDLRRALAALLVLAGLLDADGSIGQNTDIVLRSKEEWFRNQH
jgi:hypothetical protein